VFRLDVGIGRYWALAGRAADRTRPATHAAINSALIDIRFIVELLALTRLSAVCTDRLCKNDAYSGGHWQDSIEPGGVAQSGMASIC
jgi:hypothetical protein